MPQLECGNRILDLSKPVVMGILNATPDSFSDGGQLLQDRKINLDVALKRAREMVEAGAGILDVGGESTRPGADVVSEAEELDRVMPLVEAIAAELDVVISVDTSTPQVMREAAAAGAGLINDVRSLERTGAMEVAVETGLPVCIMHMQGDPQTMQQRPAYDSVVAEVQQYLRERAALLLKAGVAQHKIVIDPGYGFGKTLDHNLELLKRLPEFVGMGFPVLAGLSRKSVIGHVLGRDVGQRLAGSLSAALLAAQAGAHIIRVHDVSETVDVLKFWQAVQSVK